MRDRWILVSFLCLLGLIAACGDNTTATSAPDPADATSCADLADNYADSTAYIISLIGDRTDADMETPPADIEAAGEEWMENSFDLVRRIAELCAYEAEFDELLCDRKSLINPAGEAGERFLRDNYPACTD
jgi:hypothetical protein